MLMKLIINDPTLEIKMFIIYITADAVPEICRNNDIPLPIDIGNKNPQLPFFH